MFPNVVGSRLKRLMNKTRYSNKKRIRVLGLIGIWDKNRNREKILMLKEKNVSDFGIRRLGGKFFHLIAPNLLHLPSVFV